MWSDFRQQFGSSFEHFPRSILTAIRAKYAVHLQVKKEAAARTLPLQVLAFVSSVIEVVGCGVRRTRFAREVEDVGTHLMRAIRPSGTPSSQTT